MLNDSIDNLRLDINKPKARASISVRRGDTKTRTIHVSLTSNGVVYSLENVLIAELLIKKPDDKVCDQDMVIKGNELQYTFRTQDTNVAGECICQIRLTFKDGSYLTSPQFSMFVYKQILDTNASASQNEYSQTDALLTKANEYYENAEKLANKIESHVNDAIDAAAASAESASEAESYYLDAKEYAESAEASKDEAAETAKNIKTSVENAEKSAKDAADNAASAKEETDKAIQAAKDSSDAKKAAEDAQKAAEEAADRAAAVVAVDIATTVKAGIVKPDGTTIKIDPDGTIHGTAEVPVATATSTGVMKPDGTTVTIDADGTIHSVCPQKAATLTQLGLVKPDGTTITVDENGVIKASGNTSPIATTAAAGIVKPDGDTITIDPDGTIHGSANVDVDDVTIKKNDSDKLYTVTATTATLGVVKPDGTTITVDENGVIKASGNTSPIATTGTAGIVKPDGTSIKIDENGVISAETDIDVATTTVAGIVKPDGTTITVDENGVIKASGNTSPIATTGTAGIVKPDGDTITVDADGTIHGSASVDVDDVTIKKNAEKKIYVPTATDTTFGVVKVDNDTITIEDGVIKSSGGGVSFKSKTWEEYEALEDKKGAYLVTKTTADDVERFFMYDGHAFGDGVGDKVVCLTQAEYDALTNKKGLYYILDPEQKGGVSYSLTEEVIGKWVDGKDLYRKCYSADNVSLTSSVILDSTINANTIVPIKLSLITNNTYNVWESSFEADGVFKKITVRPSGLSLDISGFTITNYRAIIEFTK